MARWIHGERRGRIKRGRKRKERRNGEKKKEKSSGFILIYLYVILFPSNIIHNEVGSNCILHV